MANPWDERSHSEQKRLQNILLKQTVLQMALGHVPYMRSKLASLGMDARLFKGIEDLDKLPLTMRRDIIDPMRNPDGLRAVVLHGTAEGVKRFSDRSVLRRIALARLIGGEEIQELAIEAATRAIHTHLVPGPGGRIPVAYTRDDLDLFARAGARLADVVGLAREDRVLNLVPFGPSLDFWGVFYMTHGVGMSSIHIRREGQDLARALTAGFDAGLTAIVLPADEATSFVPKASEVGVDLSSIRTVLAVGRSLTIEERVQLGEQLLAAGARSASIAAAYGVAEGRVLWGECSVPAGRSETFGMHTFPDMEVLEIIDPERGKRLPEETAGEIVITPLGFRGGGVTRWRSGDLALGGMTSKPCPNCARTVPRVGPTIVRSAWQVVATLEGKRSWLDLRDAGAAAAERTSHWQVELVARNGAHDLIVHVAADEDPGPLIDLYEDLNRLKTPPTQIIVSSKEHIEGKHEAAPGPYPRYWHRSE